MMFNYFPVNSHDFAEDYWPWKFDASRRLFHQMKSSMVLEWIILGTAKHTQHEAPVLSNLNST